MRLSVTTEPADTACGNSKHGTACLTAPLRAKLKPRGWTQDLAHAIRLATHAKLANQLVGNMASECAQNVSSVIADAARCLLRTAKN